MCSSSTSASQPQVPMKLIFATDFVIDEQQASQAEAEEMFYHLIRLVKRLNNLRIAKEEYLLLKAILLTNVGKYYIPLAGSFLPQSL